MIINNTKLDKSYQFLFIAFAFVLPLTLALSNIFAYLIVILWLISGNYYIKFKEILNNKIAIASIMYSLVFVIGMLWTNDIQAGLKVIKGTLPFLLLLPIFITITQEKYVKYYVGAFLFSMSIAEISSYLIWFEIVEPFRKATVLDPSVFMDHISYNPFLTIAIYIILNRLFFSKKLTKIMQYLYIFFAITMSINMFITGGRAGQIMYFCMLAIIIFQYFNKQIIKAIIAIAIILPTIFTTAYYTSHIFNSRVNQAIHATTNFSENDKSSTGLRLNFAINSFKIIKENPIIGVGTGDYASSYKKFNGVVNHNPHNMYLFAGSVLGLFGVIVLLNLFYQQIKKSFKLRDKIQKNLALTLPLLYMLICLSDVYLTGSNSTTLLFVFLSGFLYKDFKFTNIKN